MKNCRSSRRWFFIANLLDMRDMKMKMTPSCSSRRAGLEHVLFDLERSFSKSDLRSDQNQLKEVQVRLNFPITIFALKTHVSD